MGVVCDDSALQFSKLLRQVTVQSQEFPKSNERLDHINAHLNRPRRIEHGSCHDGAVFGKGVGQYGRKPELLKVVAICDHL